MHHKNTNPQCSEQENILTYEGEQLTRILMDEGNPRVGFRKFFKSKRRLRSTISCGFEAIKIVAELEVIEIKSCFFPTSQNRDDTRFRAGI